MKRRCIDREKREKERERMSDDRLTEINNWIALCKPCTISDSILVLIQSSYHPSNLMWSAEADEEFLLEYSKTKQILVSVCIWRLLFPSECFLSRPLLKFGDIDMINEKENFSLMSVVEPLSMTNHSQFSSLHSLMEVNRSALLHHLCMSGRKRKTTTTTTSTEHVYVCISLSLSLNIPIWVSHRAPP